MNSIEQLNGFSNTLVEFTDERTGEYIIWTTPNSVDPEIAVNEGATFNIPLGSDVSEVVGDNTRITYEINYANVAGAIVTFGNTTGATVTTVGNVITISNIANLGVWNNVKSPTLSLPRDWNQSFAITGNVYSTVGASMVNNRSWTTTVSVTDLSEITTPADFVYSNVAPTSFSSYPQITDSENATGTYTLTVTVDKPSTFGNLTTGGNVWATPVWNDGTKTLTITGNRAGVNQHLSSLTYNPSIYTQDDFRLKYRLQNPAGYYAGVATEVYQRLFSSDNSIFTAVNNFSYTEDITTYVTGPELTDFVNSDSTPGYTLLVEAVDINTVSSPVYIAPIIVPWLNGIVPQGSGGTVTYGNIAGSYEGSPPVNTQLSTPNVSITGTKTEIRSHLANIALTPYPDYTGNVSLRYTITTPNAVIATRLQSITNVGTNTEISANVYLPRTYTVGNVGTFWTVNVPQILENVSGPAIYRIVMNSNAGVFVNNVAVSGGQTYGTVSDVDFVLKQANPSEAADGRGLSVWGSKSEINSVLQNLKFYPIPQDGPVNTVVRYYQKRAPDPGFVGDPAITQAYFTFPLTGQVVTNLPDEGVYTFTSNASITLTESQRYSMKSDIALVGGGGGAGGKGLRQGGGGAGGQVITREGIVWGNIANTNVISVTIGSGGAGNSNYLTVANVTANVSAPGSAGGNTTITFGNVTYLARGGGGGYSSNANLRFHASGGNTISSTGATILGGGQYQYISGAAIYGAGSGGGAGAGGRPLPYAAYSKTVETISPVLYANAWPSANQGLFGGWTANANVVVGGDGGPGQMVTIDGNVRYYGGGGAGMVFQLPTTSNIANVTYYQGLSNVYKHWPGEISVYNGGGGYAGNALITTYENLFSGFANVAQPFWSNITGANATPNTGGGGGGPGGWGGSGVAFIKFYASAQGANPAQDPDFDNVISLQHFDSSSLPDQVSGASWTTEGAAAVTSTKSRWGYGSLYLPGGSTTGFNTAVLNAGSALAWGYSDYTIELWVWFNSLTNVNTNVLMDWRTGTAQDTETFSDGLSVVGSNIYYQLWMGSPLITGTVAMTTGRWNHIAISRQSGTTRTFINGVRDLETVTKNINFTKTDARPRFGTRYSGAGAGGSIQAYIDDFRVCTEAIYTDDFVPPTGPFPNS